MIKKPKMCIKGLKKDGEKNDQGNNLCSKKNLCKFCDFLKEDGVGK